MAVLASSTSRGLATPKGLESLKLKLGHTRPLVEPRHGPQAGKSGYPRSQNTDNGEDLKVIDVNPIESLFSNINLDKYGTGYESTSVKRRPNDLKFLDLDAKIDKSGIGEVKTLSSNEPTLLDFKEFNYDNCSLIDCISLLESVLNSPHACIQNKAFT